MTVLVWAKEIGSGAARWLVVIAFFAASFTTSFSGQRLAQKNWQGSGLTLDLWWTRAIFCKVEVEKADGLKGVLQRLDSLQALGCEAIELDVSPGGLLPSQLVAAAYGTVEDADSLMEEMGRRRLRLVLDLSLEAVGGGVLSADAERALVERMRFWLARGVAGFVVDGHAQSLSGLLLGRLRQIIATTPGTRVLIGRDLIVGDLTPARGASAVQLDIIRLQVASGSAGQASTLRLRLSAVTADRSGRRPLWMPGRSMPDDSSGQRTQAAVMLGLGMAALLPVPSTAAQTLPQEHFSAEQLLLWIPKSELDQSTVPLAGLADWYKALIDLHRTHPALRSGQVSFLDRDAQNVLTWMVRPNGVGATLLFACNLSGQAARVSVASDARRQGVHGSYLKTVLRSSAADRYAATLDGIRLAPGEVFVGEIR